MVSIRRRKLLGLCSGRNSSVAPLSKSEHGHHTEIHVDNTKPVSVHPMVLDDIDPPKEITSVEIGPGSSNVPASSPSKELPNHQFPDVKRRKRHRRKHAENQEQCIMRGVYFKNMKWQAAIKVDKKQIHLGTVGSQEEAARLYDRAAFMCGREPNFELAENEKQELRKFNWDEFLAITRSAITNKKSQRRTGPGSQRKLETNDWEGEQGRNGFSASVDDTGKNYSAWEFQFQLFVKGKELWGHIDGSNPAPTDAEKLSSWEIKDARVMTWILSSVESHLILNLRPYKTAKDMWNYLKKIYNQDNTARRFQLEYEMGNFTQGSLSIEEYFSGYQNLWAEYLDIVYASVPATALSAVQAVHETSKRDQFLMKLRSDFEVTRSNLMNRDPVPSLDACLSELLREEQRIVTQAAMEHRAIVNTPINVAYAAQGKNKGRDMRAVQCYSCKEFGHIAKDCTQKFCNYCKKQGHIISSCPTRPERKQGTAFHASVNASSSAAMPIVSQIVSTPTPTTLPNPNTLTPEMVQQMIISAFSAFGLSGSSVREDDREGA